MFKEIVLHGDYLFCADDTFQYIVSKENGKVIYSKNYRKYGKSCFYCCGETEKGPVFYDAKYCVLLCPGDEKYSLYKELFNYPLIINRQNVVNITEGENGVGIADCYGEQIIENCYDEISIELKIMASDKEEKSEKTIPFLKRNFKKGDIFCPENVF